MIWYLLSKRQIKWDIVSNFVAFLENLNFKRSFFQKLFPFEKVFPFQNVFPL